MRRTFLFLINSEFRVGLARKRYLGVHQIGVILVCVLANCRMSTDYPKSPLRRIGDGQLQVLCKDVDKSCSVCWNTWASVLAPLMGINVWKQHRECVTRVTPCGQFLIYVLFFILPSLRRQKVSIKSWQSSAQKLFAVFCKNFGSRLNVGLRLLEPLVALISDFVSLCM